MVTISTVPGRLRLHCKDLVGQRGLCRRVESKLLSGSRSVSRVEASHRTGHLLVMYDAGRADLDALLEEIRGALAARSAAEALIDADDFVERRPATPSVLGGIAREAALVGIRSMLPAPWNALLPLASKLVLGPSQRT